MSEMMWGGRFRKAEEKSALDFNASVSYDCRMYKEDIAGSLAHASMLTDRGIISKKDLEKITKGLLKIKKEIEKIRIEMNKDQYYLHCQYVMGILGVKVKIIGEQLESK